MLFRSRQRKLSHWSLRAQAGRSKQLRGQDSLASWEWAPNVRDRQEEGAGQAQSPLSSAGNWPSPSWAPPGGPARAACVPDFRKSGNPVPWEAVGGGSGGRGPLCGGVASRHSPWPSLPPAWSLRARRPGRRETISLHIGAHGCSQSTRAPGRVGSRGLVAQRGND